MALETNKGTPLGRNNLKERKNHAMEIPNTKKPKLNAKAK